MSIDDQIGMGTGPVFFSGSNDLSKSHKSDSKNPNVTIELGTSELVRLQFSSAKKKFVLEIDKVAFEKQLTLQGYKCYR